jgi:hypothetical protein
MQKWFYEGYISKGLNSCVTFQITFFVSKLYNSCWGISDLGESRRLLGSKTSLYSAPTIIRGIYRLLHHDCSVQIYLQGYDNSHYYIRIYYQKFVVEQLLKFTYQIYILAVTISSIILVEVLHVLHCPVQNIYISPSCITNVSCWYIQRSICSCSNNSQFHATPNSIISENQDFLTWMNWKESLQYEAE